MSQLGYFMLGDVCAVISAENVSLWFHSISSSHPCFRKNQWTGFEESGNEHADLSQVLYAYA